MNTDLQLMREDRDRMQDRLHRATDALEQAQKRYVANEIQWMNIANSQLKRIEQLEAALNET